MDTFHRLRVIDPSRSDWCVRVKVLRNYLCYSYRSNGDVWLIFADEEGTKINVCLDSDCVQRFVRVLREGDWKVLKDFDVAINDCSVPVRHDYKILITNNTTIYGCPQVSRSLYTEFMPFEDVRRGHNCDNFLVDLIGKVTYVGKLKNMQTDQAYSIGNIGLISTDPYEVDAYRLSFRMRNNNGIEVKCLAMQQIALDIAHDLATCDLTNAVCVLRWWKVYQYGAGCFGVSSEDSVSQLLINPDFY